MQFKERLARYRAEAQKAGIPSGLIAPLPYEILWLIGVPLTPPLRQSFFGRLLTIGIPTGIAFGVAMYFIPGEGVELSVVGAVGAGVSFGVLFGIFGAIMLMIFGRFYKVPPW